MKTVTLSPAEYTRLRELVEIAQSLIEEDQEGILVDLYEPVEVAAEILGLNNDPVST